VTVFIDFWVVVFIIGKAPAVFFFYSPCHLYRLVDYPVLEIHSGINYSNFNFDKLGVGRTTLFDCCMDSPEVLEPLIRLAAAGFCSGPR